MARKRRLTREQVERSMRRAQARMPPLHDYKLTLVYGPDEDGDRAGVWAMPEYREATVYWDPERVGVHTMRECDEWMDHELTHIITWPLEKLAEHWAGEDEAKFETVRDTAEGVVTNLERVITYLRRR